MEHNVYYACGAEEALGDLARRGERAQLCYLDPPFWTGRDFGAYDDRFSSSNEYYDSMARILQGVKGAMDENGSVFVHIDERVHARLRLMMDEIFGERAFRNEIIWAYRSGGRARTHFSRKHDTILYYALSDKAFFDPLGDPLPRKLARGNHMRRGTDADGREYSAILSAGKEYRYYDDEGVAPSDVWDDIPHLQQRDPERTGYPTQKPEKLLRRVILCASRPGDAVLDVFSGSGTTLAAAHKLGRRFIGADRSPEAQRTTRARLKEIGAEWEER